MGINGDAILVGGAGIEVANPFGDDVRVGQVFLVESNDASFGGELGLEVVAGGGERNASVANFDDEVGEFEAVSDGARGGGHVAGEPVDGATADGESHLTQSLQFLVSYYSLCLSQSHLLFYKS